MKAIFTLMTIVFLPVWAAAQCAVTLTANPSGGAVPTVLTAKPPTGETAQLISWYKDGVLIRTDETGWQDKAVTVAGGNGNGTGDHQFSTAAGLFVDNDTVYVADGGKQAVMKWAPGAVTGVKVAGTGTGGAGLDQLNNPQCIWMDAARNLYVAELSNHRVTKFPAGSVGGTTGTIVAGTGTAGSALTQLNSPYGLAFDANGNMYVSEGGTHRVTKWAPGASSGTLVGGTGALTNNLAGFNTPVGVVVYKDTVFVADYSNHRVVKWAPGAATGVLVAGGAGAGGALTQLNYPRGLFVDKLGNVFVAEQNSFRVTKWAPGSSAGVLVGGRTGLYMNAGDSLLWGPQVVFISPNSGKLYVTARYDYRVQRYDPIVKDTLTVSTGGTYKVVVTTFRGCKDSAEIAILSEPGQPGVFTTAPAAVCQGQNAVNYTIPAVSGATTYEWTFTGGGVTFSGTTSTTTASNNLSFSGGASSGLLSVRAVNGAGPGPYRDTFITVNGTPAQPGNFTTSSGSICQGQTGVQYTVPVVSGATSYEWSYSGIGGTFSGTSSTATPTNNVDFSGGATSGNLQVSAKNTCGTSSARVVAVTANTPPVATVSPATPTDICEDDSVTFIAGTGSGYSFQWKNAGANVGTNSNSYVARTTGNYKVVITGAGNCKDSTQEVEVTVHNRPSGVLIPGDTAFCEGGTVTLSVQTNDTGISYRWKNGTNVIPLASASFLEVNATGEYTVVLSSNALSSCADSTPPLTVTVHPLPLVETTWDGMTLSATQGYAGYQWNTGAQPIAGATGVTFQPTTGGGFSVTVTDSNGCTATSSVHNITLNIGTFAANAVNVHIYPNPSEGTMFVKAPVPVNISLRGLDGRALQEMVDARVIDMSTYAPGVYLLHITDSNGMFIRNERIVRR
jgi:hypothetical protein